MSNTDSKIKKIKTSSSFATFLSSYRRANRLLGISKFLRDSLEDSSHSPDDILRASIVMCVAAMDAFFIDRFIEGLATHLSRSNSKCSKELLALIAEAGFDTGEAIRLLNTKRPFRRISNLMATHLSKNVATSESVIDGLYIKVGLKDFCLHVERHSKKARLLINIRRAVKRRHEIAHSSDINKHGKLQKISEKDVGKMLTAIGVFVAASEKMLSRAYPVSKGTILDLSSNTELEISKSTAPTVNATNEQHA